MSRVLRYLTPLCWFVCVAAIAAPLYVLANLLLTRLLPSGAADALQQAFGELLAMLCCFGSLFFPLHAHPPDSRLTMRTIQQRGPLLLGLIFFTAFMAQVLIYLEKSHYLSLDQ